MARSGLFPTFLPLLAAVFANAACATHSATDLYGDAVAPGAVTRTVQITPSTNYVNVQSGETIKFVVDGKEFDWAFNTASTVNRFDLNDVAPPHLLGHAVTAYIAPDPKYHMP